MKRSRVDDIINFIEIKGYKVLRIFKQLENEEGIVLDLQKGLTSGLGSCYVTDTQFFLQENSYHSEDTIDLSDDWMEHLIKVHPELAEAMLSDVNSRLKNFTNEANRRLEELKAQYQNAYNEICAEGIKLQETREKLKSVISEKKEIEA